MAKKFPVNPSHPERLCWGCDQYCAADDLRCGNGSDRTQHPVELFGEDWMAWDLGPPQTAEPAAADEAAPADPPADPVAAGFTPRS
jgi:hypothetical protein